MNSPAAIKQQKQQKHNYGIHKNKLFGKKLGGHRQLINQCLISTCMSNINPNYLDVIKLNNFPFFWAYSIKMKNYIEGAT